MTLDDDSLLSGYLDGQLSPDEQQAVESALAFDPRLAEQLRHLSTVRELLAGLSRDAPVDVTGPVMNRIGMRQRLWTLLAVALPPARATPRWARAAGRIAAIAATILIVLASPWLFRLRPLAPGRPAENSNPVTPNLRTSLPSTTPVRQLDASAPQAPSSVSPNSHDGASGRIDLGGLRPAKSHDVARAREVSAPTELEHARQYLDNPNLRHVLMIADMDGTAQQQVASVVEQTTRYHYVKITIAQGIVIDPRHPDQATVFALVVSPQELEMLRHRLRQALKDRVEEPTVDPRIVTQLADIGDVQTFRPRPAGDLDIPRDALAIKHVDDGRPTPEQYRSAPVAQPAPSQTGSAPRSERYRALAVGAATTNSPDAVRIAPAPSPDRVAARSDARGPGGPPGPVDTPAQTLVVLVWVSRPRSDPGH